MHHLWLRPTRTASIYLGYGSAGIHNTNIDMGGVPAPLLQGKRQTMNVSSAGPAIMMTRRSWSPLCKPCCVPGSVWAPFLG